MRRSVPVDRVKRNAGGHFHLPFQFIMGVIFLGCGALLVLRAINMVYLAEVPDTILSIVCAVGSFIGGLYMIITKLHRPRLYLN